MSEKGHGHESHHEPEKGSPKGRSSAAYLNPLNFFNEMAGVVEPGKLAQEAADLMHDSGAGAAESLPDTLKDMFSSDGGSKDSHHKGGH